ERLGDVEPDVGQGDGQDDQVLSPLPGLQGREVWTAQAPGWHGSNSVAEWPGQGPRQPKESRKGAAAQGGAGRADGRCPVSSGPPTPRRALDDRGGEAGRRARLVGLRPEVALLV